MKTRQELFNNAYLGMIEQGAYAFDEERGECCYRAPTGEKCAIGLSIPDDLYDTEMDSWTEPENQRAFDAAGIPRSASWFAAQLQSIHDILAVEVGSFDKTEWIAAMTKFAHNNDLEVPKL